MRRSLVGEDFHEYECNFLTEACDIREVLIDDEEAKDPEE